MINPFFKNSGPFKISDILQLINLDDLNIDNNQEINDIKDLFTSKINDIMEKKWLMLNGQLLLLIRNNQQQILITQLN